MPPSPGQGFNVTIPLISFNEGFLPFLYLFIGIPEFITENVRYLLRYTKGIWQRKRFNGKIEILPSNSGKKVVSKEK